MRKLTLITVLAVAWCILGSAGLAQNDGFELYVGKPSCLGVVARMGLPVELDTHSGRITASTSEQVDRVLIELRRALQGHACALRFGEVFRLPGGTSYFPLTNYVVSLSPAETFAGIQLYNPEEQPVGQFDRRLSIENEPGFARSDIVLPFYYFHYLTNQGRMVSSGNRLLFASYLVDWNDVASRWALDTYSDARLRLAGRSYP